MARLTDADPAEIADRIGDRLTQIDTAVKIIDFVRDWWWVILLGVLVIAWLPRGDRSR